MVVSKGCVCSHYWPSISRCSFTKTDGKRFKPIEDHVHEVEGCGTASDTQMPSSSQTPLLTEKPPVASRMRRWSWPNTELRCSAESILFTLHKLGQCLGSADGVLRRNATLVASGSVVALRLGIGWLDKGIRGRVLGRSSLLQGAICQYCIWGVIEERYDAGALRL